jgi:hypothetical protein
MGTSLFDLGLTCFAITVPIGFGKVEVSKTSQLGVRTATQLNKQGFKELRLDAEKYKYIIRATDCSSKAVKQTSFTKGTCCAIGVSLGS